MKLAECLMVQPAVSYMNYRWGGGGKRGGGSVVGADETKDERMDVLC